MKLDINDGRLPSRFWIKVHVDGDCWIWTGAMRSRPVFWLNGRNEAASHVLLSAVGQVVEPGQYVGVTCGDMRCLSPAHQSVARLADLRSATNFRPELRDRLESKISATPTASGCLEFTGTRNQDGYGVLHNRDGELKAHRVAWQLVHGDIPADLVVMHECDNPPCCNVAHLRLGTVGDNNRDRHAKGRTKGLRNAARVEEGIWP